MAVCADRGSALKARASGHPLRRPFLRGLVGCAVLPLLACAKPHDPGRADACALQAWVAETDPAGVAVRAAASPDAATVGRLPPWVRDGDGRGFGPSVHLVGSHGGWLQIEAAADDPARSGLPQRATYAGRGWVRSDQVSLGVQSGRGHSQPAGDSSVLLDLGTDWLSSLGRVERVVACRANWAQVDFRLERERDRESLRLRALPADDPRRSTQRAWFTHICGNQETTCDRP